MPQASNDPVDRYRRTLRTFKFCAGTLVHSADTDAIRRVLFALVAEPDTDLAFLAKHEPSTDEPQVVDSVGADGTHQPDVANVGWHRVPLIAEALESGKTKIFSTADLTADEREMIESDSDFVCWVLAPVRLDGEWIGTLGIAAADANVFDEADVGLLDAVAEMVGTLWLRERHANEATDTSSMLDKEIEQRRSAEAVAEQATKAKTDFLTNMSHEVRTPMNGILGLSELMLETELLPDQREQIEMIRTSGKELLSLINDILDLSWIESGKLGIELMPFSLRNTIAHIIDTFRPLAREKGLHFDMWVDEGLPDDVVGDPGRVRQIITALVSNAIKFTDKGGVWIRVMPSEEQDDGVGIHVAVQDTGIGIPAEAGESIFETFTQVDGSLTRHFGGTGVGLSIAKRLVELMEGRMWLQSEIGYGTTFNFTLLLQESKTPIENPPEAGTASILTVPVLVVSDNRKTSADEMDALQRAGMKPVRTTTPHEAVVELNRAFSDGTPYSLVLVDADEQLEAASRIRTQFHADRPDIMVITTSGQRGDATRCRELEVGAYISRPIQPDDLIWGVKQLIAQRGTEDPKLITRHTIREARTKKRVLVAEDSPTNRKIVELLLMRRGFGVVAVEDGHDAIEAWRSEDFDAILMDVQMPRMDGIEATIQIRQEEAEGDSHIPIVALTAHALSGDRERCLEAGMDAYLTKPLRFEELLAVLAQISEGEGFAAVERSDPMHGTGAITFNSEAALQAVGNDPEFLREVVEMFVKQCPAELADLEAAVTDSEVDRVDQLAHKLKGELASIGAEAAFLAAKHLNELARAHQPESFADAWSTLRFEVELLEGELAQILDPETD